MTLRSNYCAVALFAFAPLITLSGPLAAAVPKTMTCPDFTRGDKIPAGAPHDWTLGATGARGWMYCDTLVTADARQIYITRVDVGSPADGKLKVGDVILGVAGKAFAYDPRTEFGKALTDAESEKNHGNLELLRWRDGKTESLVLKLQVLGAYSATAPYDCPKSKRILELGCKALAKRIATEGNQPNSITRAINALALLASGNPDYLPLLRSEAQWAAAYSTPGSPTWSYGYVTIFLSEYIMATGDLSVMPGLKRLVLESAKGQSLVGSWGHGFAQPDGRLGGYGMMNAPGVPLTCGLTLARMAGVKDPALDMAIDRSDRMMRFYIGKGAIPYGDHHPWIQNHEDNGKCGMVATMFYLLGNAAGTEFFSRMSLASHGAERDTGHTGNFFNILWALPGVAQSGPQATGAWMNEFGAWYFDLARRWDGTFIHQGPPEMKDDSYGEWDATGGYLLACALPLKKICLTGKLPSLAPQLDATAAQSVIVDGRGWSNKDRTSAYAKLTEVELLARLASWSPVVRERAAIEFSRRPTDSVPALVKMLASPDLNTRYGTCQTLALLKGRAAPAVPALTQTLRHEDLWLRVKAADALAAIGGPAMSAVPDLLQMLAKAPSASDPRGMEQRYLSFALFGTMLNQSLNGIDRDLLYSAVRAGLRNQDGRARGAYGSVYKNLTFDEIKPLLPAIFQAIVEPSPSGEMFGSAIRLSGCELLAKYRIREGMALCCQIMAIEEWGKRSRIMQCLKILQTYGGAARPVLPQLRQLEQKLLAHPEAKTMQEQIDECRATIRKIETATEIIELRGLNGE